MDDIYGAGRAQSGHGSLALLYWQQNQPEPTVLMRVTPAPDGWASASWVRYQ